jgi:hypothetical protein
MSLFRSLGHTKVSVQVRGFVCEYFVTKMRFHGEELLAPHQTPKLEDHPLSAIRDSLFNIFAATLHIGARGGAVGLGTALQAGRSWFRFPMVSLEFFINIILPTALWSWG